MPSVVHVVTTRNFAGVERYVCNVSSETASRGWKTAVVGGDGERMRAALGPEVRWLPGSTPLETIRSLARSGRQTICHAHMTLAEGVAVAARPLHRAPIVSTRHFAARRGSTRKGHLLGPQIAKRLDREIAVSEFVARQLERFPDAVIPSGVAPTPCVWHVESHVVLVLQRLEREKETLTALRAWRAAGLAKDGWSLRIVGDGSERRALEAWVAAHDVPGVAFKGWASDVLGEFAQAGMLLAPTAADAFGLTVVEAMAAGVPVVACAAGGHLETIGLTPNAHMFPPGDAGSAAEALRSLLPDEARARASSEGRELAAAEFTIARHVDRLLSEYERALKNLDESVGMAEVRAS